MMLSGCNSCGMRTLPTVSPSSRNCVSRLYVRQAGVACVRTCRSGISCRASLESRPSLVERLGLCSAPAVLAACLLLNPSPAVAEIQTVPLSQVTEAAKPLPKQTIDKGKVWLYFIGGAIGLFAATIVVENNAAWFPAISRANKAMAMSAPPMQVQEEDEAVDVAAAEVEDRQTQAVLEGLASARKKVLEGPSDEELQQQLQKLQQQQQEEVGTLTPASASSSSSNTGSSSSSSSSQPPAARESSGTEISSSSSSSSTSGASDTPAPYNSSNGSASASYTVVTDVKGAAAAAVPASWSAEDVGVEETAAAAAVSASRLEGMLEGQAAMKEYREKQAQKT